MYSMYTIHISYCIIKYFFSFFIESLLSMIHSKKNKLVFGFLFVLSLIPSPVSADYDFLKTPEMQIAAIKSGVVAGLVAFGAACQYVNNTYLVREEYLVKSKYPFAQAWYDSMAQKYPDVCLEDKLFLQTMRGSSAKYMSWCSTFNEIYFPQDSLREINALYEKSLKGENLTDEESLFLSKEEFILLHEAGHIVHSDLKHRFAVLAGVFAATSFAEAFIIDNYSNEFALSIKDRLLLQLSIVSSLSNLFSRYNERQADKYSYSRVDDNGLQGALSFFNSEEINPFANVEDKELSPFIKTDSWLGSFFQDRTSKQDQAKLDKLKKIKKSSWSLWWYDLYHRTTHPSPWVRAQAVQDEIDRRATQEVDVQVEQCI